MMSTIPSRAAGFGREYASDCVDSQTRVLGGNGHVTSVMGAHASLRPEPTFCMKAATSSRPVALVHNTLRLVTPSKSVCSLPVSIDPTKWERPRVRSLLGYQSSGFNVSKELRRGNFQCFN